MFLRARQNFPAARFWWRSSRSPSGRPRREYWSLHRATRAAQAAIGGQFQTVLVEGADEASSNATSQGATDSSIVVQKGATVFNISIPKAADAQQQLVKLSEIVISRLKQ